MATPIQFIREQIANAAIDPSKLDLATAGITYNFGSVALEASTESQGDNSTKVATTAYVDTAVSDAQPTGGAGIDITAGTIAVDIAIGSSGLTFSGAGDSAQLQIALAQSGADRNGLELASNGYLGVLTQDANGLEIDTNGLLKVKLDSSSFLELGANGLGAGISTDIFGVVGGLLEIKSQAIVTDLIANNAVNKGKLALRADYEEFTANGSTSVFTLANDSTYPAMAQVFKNGQRMSYVASSPGADEYTLSGTTLTFGQNVTNGAIIQVSHFYEV